MATTKERDVVMLVNVMTERGCMWPSRPKWDVMILVTVATRVKRYDACDRHDQSGTWQYLWPSWQNRMRRDITCDIYEKSETWVLEGTGISESNFNGQKGWDLPPHQSHTSVLARPITAFELILRGLPILSPHPNFFWDYLKDCVYENSSRTVTDCVYKNKSRTVIDCVYKNKSRTVTYCVYKNSPGLLHILYTRIRLGP